MLLSSIANAQWNPLESSPAGYLTNMASFDGTLYATHFSQGVFRSQDSAATWEPLINGLDNYQARSVFELLVNGDDILIATSDGIYKSTNNGISWIRRSEGIIVGNGAVYAFTESIFENDNILFTGAWTGIYRSSDNGESWLPTNATGRGVLAKNFTNHGGLLFAARESNNTPYGYKSTDSGISWEPISTITRPLITLFSEAERLWAGTIDGVWLSQSSGDSWEHRIDGLAIDPYNSSIIRVNGNLVTSLNSGGSGIYLSRNDGVLWEDFGQGLPFLSSIDKLLVFGDKILAATSDGLYQRDISEIPTRIESSDGNMPQAFSLSQNYPNPFNSSATIEYSIVKPIHVTLKVYDIMGREAATLVDNFQNPATYRTTFDASALSGGIYIYRLQAGEIELTQKALFLK